MFDLLGLIYDVILNKAVWLMQVVVRLLCVLFAIPFVFFMPKGRAYQHLSYTQVLAKRFKFLGRSVVDAFKGNVG